MLHNVAQSLTWEFCYFLKITIKQQNRHAKLIVQVVMQSMDEAGNISWSSLISVTSSFPAHGETTWDLFYFMGEGLKRNPPKQAQLSPVYIYPVFLMFSMDLTEIQLLPTGTTAVTPSHWCKLIFLTGHRTHTVRNCLLMGGALLQISLQAERFWLKKKTMKKWLQTINFSPRGTGSSVQAAVLLVALSSCRGSELHCTPQHCWGIRSRAHPRGRMHRGQLSSSNGKVSISVVPTVSESHDTQAMKHRKSHSLEINSTMRAQSMQFFHCSDCTREWKQQVENLGFRKAEAATKQEPKFDLVLVYFYNERINRSGNTTTCRLWDLAFKYKLYSC